MSIKSKLQRKLANEIRAKYRSINVIPEQGLFNQKCFYNAVEFAKKNEKYAVIEVMIIGNQTPVLHYINHYMGEFYETTLGFRCAEFEYYFIRVINKSDYKDIAWEFENSANYWSNKYVSWYHKILGIRWLV